MTFAGTTQKCSACEKTVYLVDRLAADNRIYHKACFRCYHCKSTLKELRKSQSQKNLWRTRMVAGAKSQVYLQARGKNVWAALKLSIRLRSVNGTAYHKGCFKCSHGGCTISPSNYIAHEGRLYCKHHHIQLFKEKGNYSQLESDHET
ncbi:LIM domain-containing protein WLIM1-like isoform X2 [Nicotiana tomentosiformis]|uniref:LIM domain-containing protein WLIM1-like isoform X2 n=1 Tax=Nicotiana tomentosiformis TaxID=4098 RepID=UPI00388C8A42